MKRFFALCLAMVMAVTLAACGGGEKESTPQHPVLSAREVVEARLALELHGDKAPTMDLYGLEEHEIPEPMVVAMKDYELPNDLWYSTDEEVLSQLREHLHRFYDRVETSCQVQVRGNMVDVTVTVSALSQGTLAGQFTQALVNKAAQLDLSVTDGRQLVNLSAQVLMDCLDQIPLHHSVDVSATLSKVTIGDNPSTWGTEEEMERLVQDVVDAVFDMDELDGVKLLSPELLVGGDGGRPVLTVGVPLVEGDSDRTIQVSFLQQLEEKAGCRLEFIYLSDEDAEWRSQLNTMIAAGEPLPYVMVGFNWSMEEYSVYGEDGYLMDLTPYFDQGEEAEQFRSFCRGRYGAAYFAGMLEQNTAPDGCIYAFPVASFHDVDAERDSLNGPAARSFITMDCPDGALAFRFLVALAQT